MTIKFYNNASTTVAGSITALDTTVALAANSGTLFLPTPTGGDYFVATFYDQQTKTVNEIVHVTNITGDVATIVRAQEGTTARPWSSGDIFANLITAGTLDSFVQAGVGAADTSIVYVGTDTSTDPHHIVANTTPVPANFAIGMLFNIKMLNSKSPDPATGYIDMILNGKPAVITKHTDGSNIQGGYIYAALEYMFVYNGSTFSSTLMHVVQKPPQLTFYVRSDSTSTVDTNTGIETNDGLANTATSAFKTIQGASNTIISRYISTDALKLMVSDGNYIGGLNHNTQYVSKWEVQGNDSNPQNCVIDSRSITPANYVKNAPVGGCFSAGSSGNLFIHGFRFLSNGPNIAAGGGGRIKATNCDFSFATAVSEGAITASKGSGISVAGNCRFLGGSGHSIFHAAYSGSVSIGIYSYSPGVTEPLYWNFLGATTCQIGVIYTDTSGVVSVANYTGGIVNVSGVTPITGYEYNCNSGGGVGYGTGLGGVFPSTQGGIVTPPGWAT